MLHEVTADHAHSALKDKQAEEADRAERVAKVHKDLEYDDSENTRFAVEEAKLVPRRGKTAGKRRRNRWRTSESP